MNTGLLPALPLGRVSATTRDWGVSDFSIRRYCSPSRAFVAGRSRFCDHLAAWAIHSVGWVTEPNEIE